MQQRTWWLSSFGIGAAAAFLLDPTSGKRRRHRVADATTRIGHRTRHSASTVMHDLGNRTHGVITIARRRFAREQPDDRVLEERVHSALGRVVSHPHAITVKVCEGRVTLDGPIPPRETHRILHAVSAVAGVKDIETAFDPHIQPAYEPSSEAARPGALTPPRPDFLQPSWAPATRAIGAGAGAALVGAGIARRDRVGAGLAAAGAALIARAATNLPLRRLVGIGPGRRDTAPFHNHVRKDSTMPLRVNSPAFTNGAAIPKKYTCDGQNVAPPLEWSGVPKESKSVAILCEDPDAPSGTFTHWVLYDVPASVERLGEGAAAGKAGVNDFGKAGFGGPCPPRKDNAHHYRFHVYALDVESLGPAGLSKQDASKAMEGHVLAEGELTGIYKRASG